MDRTYSGKLIVFEGVDGTGKSTQLTMLSDYLTQRGFDVVTTREPTNGPFGQQIRELYVDRSGVTREEELQLFLDDRQEHVNNLIMPALQTGKIVLCDRYFLSTAAYQGANGFDPNEIIRLNAFAPSPDLALVFEVSLKTSILRITEVRGDQLNDFEQAEALAQVKKIFASLELPYIKTVDTEQSINDVHRDVVNLVSELLKFPDPALPK